MKPLPADLAALAAGGKAALARCLTALEQPARGPGADRAPRGRLAGAARHRARADRPARGRKVHADQRACWRGLRGRGETVAVIAVDPSSRAVGRRAPRRPHPHRRPIPDDPGAFVRSMAARRRLGGLADTAFPAVVLLRALFDWVIVETVGVGQSETEIADCADLVRALRPARVRRRAAVHEGRDHGGARPRARHQGRPRRPGRARRGGPARGAVAGRGGRTAARSLVVSAPSGEGLAAALDGIDAACAADARPTSPRAAGGAGPRLGREPAGQIVRTRVGAALLAPRLLGQRSPFAALAGLSGTRAKRASRKLLKTLNRRAFRAKRQSCAPSRLAVIRLLFESAGLSAAATGHIERKRQ